MASRPGVAVEKDQQWAVLKCPRCESSNTKFCYYNNYSLSQPRHFCKACKRYWTRGGTLRNVPVGGGCRRKNKRPKRPNACSGTTSTIIDRSSSSLAPSSVSVSANVAANTSLQHHPLAQPQNNNQIIDMSLNSSLFYSLLPSNKYPLDPEVNHLQFPPRLHISNGFDHLNHLNHLPSLPLSSGFDSSKQTVFQDLITTYNNPVFCATKQPQLAPNHFQTLEGNGEAASGTGNIAPYQMSSSTNLADQVGFSDPSLYWNSTSLSTSWHDPPNVGS